MEGVAVGRLADVAGLEIDGAAEERCDIGFVGGGCGGYERLVGLELVCAIAEPHGIDVACCDEGKLQMKCQVSLTYGRSRSRRFTSYLFIWIINSSSLPLDSSIQSVRPGILKKTI